MGIYDEVAGATRSVHAFVSSVNVDDSWVPYFAIALGFMVVEYIFHTILDLRQRQVSPGPVCCASPRRTQLPQLQCRDIR
jgi:hypothetical protein